MLLPVFHDDDQKKDGFSDLLTFSFVQSLAGASRIMVNRPSGVSLLGYAYQCLNHMSLLYLISLLLESRIEPNNNK